MHSINYKYHPRYHPLEAYLWENSSFKKHSEELSILSINRYYGPREIRGYHQHVYWEMGCIVKGSVDFDCDGCTKLEAGTVLVVPPKTSHTEKSIASVDIIWILFYGNFLDEKALQTYVSVKNKELASMIERLWIFTEIEEANTGPEIDAKITEIVARFFRIQPISHNPQTSDITEMAIKYLHAHMSEKISIPDVAKKMGCSQTYFRRLFKMRTGRSSLEYLLRLRLQHAKSLLKQTNIPIAEIAHSIGYEDAFYFSRVFKKACGISPSHFRNSIEDIDI